MSNFNFENRLEQKQILLPALILEMKLIAMNAVELEQFVKEKAEENPFIDYEENSEKIAEYLSTYNNIGNSEFTSSDLIDKTKHQYDTIYDYFENELNFFDITNDEKELALLLVPYLSNNGILKEKLENIAKQIDVPYYKLENGKIALLAIDSKGYGSENFKEMILTQIWLSEKKESLFLFDALINHYDDILYKNFSKLKKYGYNEKDIDKILNLMIEIIHIPDSIIQKNENYIIPDAIIRIKNGKIVYKIIELFNLYLNKYQISDYSDDIKKLFNEAKNLDKALSQRKSTFENFLKHFVILQQNFFYKGEKYIHPISQKDFAQKIGISESTISRIVNNKYIDTPFGIFPLKYFFTSSYSKKMGKIDSSNIQSRNLVINAIKEIIRDEPKDNPYSDEEIVEILRKKGYYISRRTCSKYRDIAGIPSKQLRKGVIKK